MNDKRTDMKYSTYQDIRADHQVKNFDALNTYKIKLSTTHATNYTASGGSETAHSTGLTSANGDQNSFRPKWFLPAIEANHIKKCYMRVVSVSIPSSVYSFEGVDGDGHTNYSLTPLTENPVMFVECSKVLDKSFVSVSGGKTIRKSVLGSINTTSFYKVQENHTNKTPNVPVLQHIVSTGNDNMSDNEWVLADNPFGSQIDLCLVLPSNLTTPIIKSSKDGLIGEHIDDSSGGGAKDNNLIDCPIVYEIEIKLIPDFSANDKFSY